MASSAGASSVIRFGAFELDGANGELRKAGVSLKIHPQPLQVLLLLAQHAGQTVTREEIQRCLWGDNTFVDFERGINFCVNQIRATLGDDAEKPRYVETLPRRGYRFIAPIKMDISGTTPGLDEHVSEGPADQGFRPVAVPAEEAATLLHSHTAAPTRKHSHFLAALGLVVVIALAVGWQWRARQRVVPIRSLAVLPFENLSGDAAQDYFADGMTEALITELGKISALRVISRQSMMQYKGTKKSAPEIASELKVDAVIEGSVQRVGDSARVSVQLIQAAPERHLWADSYDRQARDVLALHGEVARTVAKEIKVTLTPQEEVRLASARTVNPAANEAYFRGRYFLDRRSKADIDEALADLQKAVDLDPKFAPAYASLSEAYLAVAFYDSTHQAELTAKAYAATLKALELDDTLSAAHYTLGAHRARAWDWSGAEGEYRRAIELNPSNASAHTWYADLLVILGRISEADVETQRAEDLDPASLEVYGAATAPLYYGRRFDQLIEHCQGWVKRNPNMEWNYHHCLGAIYVQVGRHEEAITELREALKSSTMFEHTATELAHALAVAGKRREAWKALDPVQNVPWRTFGAALVHTGLGEKDEAFHSLEKAIDLRAPLIVLLKVDPRFDSLRQDPRFPNLLRRMNLPS
jgi:TolB-like protein/DNA-binding winged helix-turn-helix (wHTH) protein/Flp pilus assembly protein TadD